MAAEPFVRRQRGERPSKEDFLTDEELRARALMEQRNLTMDSNAKARRLAIMQEHKTNVEQANAMTRDRTLVIEEAEVDDDG